VSVALVIQHAKRMRHVILSSVACLAVPYFSTLSHKQQDFRKKVTEHRMCVLISSTTFVWNISHFRKNSERYYHKYTYVFTLSTRYSCQILMRFARNFLDRFSKNNIRFHKNACSGNTVVSCGRTDRHDEANTRFSQYFERVSRPNNRRTGNTSQHTHTIRTAANTWVLHTKPKLITLQKNLKLT
jgi:hypothetical protein